MTETTESSAPWAKFGEPAGLSPGRLVLMHRAEAAEAAEEARRAQEVQDRADARQELAIWEARQYSAMRGLPWDPAAPFANLPNVVQRADELFAHQDAAERRDERRRAREAGLLHLLPTLLAGSGVYQVDGGPSEVPPGSGRASSASAERSAAIKSRVRRALARMPKLGPRDAHPTMTDGWVPDYRDPDTGRMVRYGREVTR